MRPHRDMVINHLRENPSSVCMVACTPWRTRAVAGLPGKRRALRARTSASRWFAWFRRRPQASMSNDVAQQKREFDTFTWPRVPWRSPPTRPALPVAARDGLASGIVGWLEWQAELSPNLHCACASIATVAIIDQQPAASLQCSGSQRVPDRIHGQRRALRYPSRMTSARAPHPPRPRRSGRGGILPR